MGTKQQRYFLLPFFFAPSSSIMLFSPQGDVLDRVLDGCELSDSSPLSDEQMWQLCDEVKTFLLAGHETTASTLIWSVYEVA
jgi:cytochrome P450